MPGNMPNAVPELCRRLPKGHGYCDSNAEADTHIHAKADVHVDPLADRHLDIEPDTYSNRYVDFHPDVRDAMLDHAGRLPDELRHE
jgi:hypothetical protein